MRKRLAALVFTIFLFTALYFVVKPGASIKFDETSISGYSAIQLIVEDWSLLDTPISNDGIIHTDEGDFNGHFYIVKTIPPNYRLGAFPRSFFYHHLFISPVTQEAQDVIKSGKASVTYYVDGKPNTIYYVK